MFCLQSAKGANYLRGSMLTAFRDDADFLRPVGKNTPTLPLCWTFSGSGDLKYLLFLLK